MVWYKIWADVDVDRIGTSPESDEALSEMGSRRDDVGRTQVRDEGQEGPVSSHKKRRGRRRKKGSMATRRGRRGPKVNWLPVFGQGIEPGGNQHSNGWLGELAIPGDVNDFSISGTALTFDEAKDDDAATPATTSLADFIGSGYFLRRIVRKFPQGFKSGARGRSTRGPRQSGWASGSSSRAKRTK